MNKKLLLLGLIPLAICLVTTSVSASAQVSRYVYNNVGRDSMTVEPYPGFKMVSEWTWNNHILSSTVFDAKGNLHIYSHYASTGMVNGQFWQWNGVEWILTYEWSQKLNTVGGYNSLIVDFFSENQTARQIDIHNENFQAVVRDPSTGEVISTSEYTIIAHLLMKWLNGELQFDLSWTINRP